MLVAVGCQAPWGDDKLEHSTPILGKRVTVVVTTDGGRELVIKRNIPLRKTSTALSVLRDVADVRMGDNNTIAQVNGLGGGRLTAMGAEQAAWFYRVNGIEATARPDRFKVRPGSTIWWDLRRYDIYERLPVAVGVFPQPLFDGYRDNVRPVRIAYGSKFEEDAEYFRDSVFEAIEPEVESIEPDEGIGGGHDGPQPKAAVRKDRSNLVIARWEEARLDPYIADIGLDPRGYGLTVWIEGTTVRRQDPDEEFSRDLERAEGVIWASTVDGEPDGAVVVLVTGLTDEGVRAAAQALRHAKVQFYLAAAVDREGKLIP
jgi:hypothetical protein